MLSFLICAPLQGQSVALTGRTVHQETVVFRLGLDFQDSSFLFEELNADRHISLSFTVRLYRENTGFLSLFGDSVISSATMNRVLSRDYISGQYVIDMNGSLTYFTDSVEFFTRAAEWNGTLVMPEPGLNRLYLKGRAVIGYNVLEKPLKVMDFFFPDRNTVLDWVTFSLGDAPEMMEK